MCIVQKDPHAVMQPQKQVLLVPRLPESRQWISKSLWKAIEFVLEIGDKHSGVQVAMVSIKDRTDASKRYDMVRVSHNPSSEIPPDKGSSIIGLLSPQYNEYIGTIEVSERAIKIYSFLLFDSARELKDMYLAEEGERSKDGPSVSDELFYASLIQELLILSGSSFRLATGPYPELENKPGYAVIPVDSELRTPVSFIDFEAQAPVSIARGDAPPDLGARPLRIATEMRHGDKNSVIKKSIPRPPNKKVYI